VREMSIEMVVWGMLPASAGDPRNAPIHHLN
jgi:hypothetical protein